MILVVGHLWETLFPYNPLAIIPWRDVVYKKGDMYLRLRSLLLNHFITYEYHNPSPYSIVTMSFDSM